MRESARASGEGVGEALGAAQLRLALLLHSAVQRLEAQPRGVQRAGLR